MTKKVKSFFENSTSTLSYIVFDEKTKDAIIIDPVLNYNLAASEVSYESINEMMSFIHQNNLKVYYCFETHVHADHFSGSCELKKELVDSQVCISAEIAKVQKTFGEVFNLVQDSFKDKFFDRFLKDGNILIAGSMKIQVIATPGHTPCGVSYLIDDLLFTGDTLFMPDFGTGRCDFPNGDASQLFHSIQEKLYCLPEETKVFVGHDYCPNGRELLYETTIREEKKENIHLKEDTTLEDFVNFRVKRDKTLMAPKLLFNSIQINIKGGAFPERENNGISYLKIPLTVKR